MTNNHTLAVVELMLGVEAELAAMRQLLIFLAAERFSAVDNPYLAIKAASSSMMRSLEANECLDDTIEATERIQTEIDQLLDDVRQLLLRASSGD